MDFPDACPDRPTEPNSHSLDPLPAAPYDPVPASPPEQSSADDLPPAADDAPPATVATGPSAAAAAAYDVANQFLGFCATAAPETLAVVLGGMALVLYVLFGRLGLLLVGVVVGAVGHASLGVAGAKRDGSVLGASLAELLPKRAESAAWTLEKVRAAAQQSSGGADDDARRDPRSGEPIFHRCRPRQRKPWTS